MTDYASLIERLEKADGPDREIDAELAIVGLIDATDARLPSAERDSHYPQSFVPGQYWTGHAWRVADEYTSSLDAALGLACDEPGAWVAQNVIPIIDVPGADAVRIPPTSFGRFIADFLDGDPYPVIVSDWPDDIRYFCQALIVGPGQMVNIPRLRFEIVRVDAYPTTLEGAVQHNALWDARALRHCCTPQAQGQQNEGAES